MPGGIIFQVRVGVAIAFGIDSCNKWVFSRKTENNYIENIE